MTVVGAVEKLPLKEFRRLDRNAEEQGVPVPRLMANAGQALAKQIRDRAGNRHVVLLCGKGNNGGDGFAAAGLLARWGIEHTVVLLEPAAKVRGPARAYLDMLDKAHIKAWKGARRSGWKGALVVDCMLGSGIRGPPRAPYAAAIKWVNAHDGPVLACDIPSGLGTKLAVKPQATVTFHAAKEGMTKSNSGTIIVASIGIPRDAGLIGLGDLDVAFMRPEAESHKGDNGRVLVVGGGPFTGAPHYAGMAAYRAGADLVHLATTAQAAAVISSWGPDLLVHAVCDGSVLAPVALPAIEELLERVDAVVIGPGLGQDAAATELARIVIDAAGKQGLAMVIDADGLDAVTPERLKRHGARMVLTPHDKEFHDLAGKAATQAHVAAFASQHQTVVVKKGATDIVAGDIVRLCKRGHPTMTVGGTGDALAGAIATLLARGADPFDAACGGAYLLGCAGELAASLRSHGATTTDIIEAIPAILLRLDD